MTIPHTFATYPAGNFPASDWDTNWSFVAALTNIFCTATGTNSIALTPAASSPTVTAYQSGMTFLFTAANNNSAATTIAVGSLAAASVYTNAGVLLVGGEILSGVMYEAIFDQTLGGGAGGFRLLLSVFSSVTTYPTNVPGPSFTFGNGVNGTFGGTFNAPQQASTSYTLTHNAQSLALAGFSRIATGSGTDGPTSADNTIFVNLAKTNWLTSTVAGEMDALDVNTFQGLKGDAAGLLVGVFKTYDGYVTGTGAPLGLEISTRWIQSDPSATILDNIVDIHALVGFGGGPITANLGVGFYAESFGPDNTTLAKANFFNPWAGFYAGAVNGYTVPGANATNFVNAFVAAGDRSNNAIYYRVTGGLNQAGDIVVGSGNALGLDGTTATQSGGTRWTMRNVSGDWRLIANDGSTVNAKITQAGVLTTNNIASPTTGLGLGKVAPWQGGYVAGRLYTMPAGGAINTVALAANTVYYCFLTIGENHTFDRIAIEVSTTGTATNARLAIYNVAGGIPTSLVVDGGTVAVGTTGLKTVTISQALTPGTYALAVVCDGTVTVDAATVSNISIWQFTGVTDFSTPDAQANGALTFGAFPGTAGALTYSNANVPVIGLRA